MAAIDSKKGYPFSITFFITSKHEAINFIEKVQKGNLLI